MKRGKCHWRELRALVHNLRCIVVAIAGNNISTFNALQFMFSIYIFVFSADGSCGHGGY